MSRIFLLPLFIFSTLICYGQKSELIQNINYRAKELKHSLNESGDSLLLQSDRTIYSVEIFNSGYEKKVKIDSTIAKIPLDDTPLGRFVVEAKLIDKRIVMTLLRSELINEPELKDDVIEENLTVNDILNSADTEKKTTSNYSPSAILNTRLKTKSNENLKYYWVIVETNTGNSSSKIMRLVNEALVFKIISKNKLETQTAKGKLNTLTVWEVYNTTKFMREQLRNPDYINSTTSTLFNVEPYFITKKVTQTR